MTGHYCKLKLLKPSRLNTISVWPSTTANDKNEMKNTGPLHRETLKPHPKLSKIRQNHSKSTCQLSGWQHWRQWHRQAADPYTNVAQEYAVDCIVCWVNKGVKVKYLLREYVYIATDGTLKLPGNFTAHVIPYQRQPDGRKPPHEAEMEQALTNDETECHKVILISFDPNNVDYKTSNNLQPSDQELMYYSGIFIIYWPLILYIAHDMFKNSIRAKLSMCSYMIIVIINNSLLYLQCI